MYYMGYYVDDIIYQQLLIVRNNVLTKDIDWFGIYDGREGSGKSTLAQQHAKVLDPTFCIDDICFTGDQFIARITDPNIKRGKAIILDEAYMSANARGALTEINKAIIGLATQIRQLNLFVLIVLPTFFDLERYFAIFRCRALFHVYFSPEGERRYVTFDERSKKILYMYQNNKKFYSYGYPKAPFPPAKFNKGYVVDEKEYRKRKADAFRIEPVSARKQKWMQQRDALIRILYYKLQIKTPEINKLLKEHKVAPISEGLYSLILKSDEKVME